MILLSELATRRRLWPEEVSILKFMGPAWSVGSALAIGFTLFVIARRGDSPPASAWRARRRVRKETRVR
jgi:hypothetical protein